MKFLCNFLSRILKETNTDIKARHTHLHGQIGILELLLKTLVEQVGLSFACRQNLKPHSSFESYCVKWVEGWKEQTLEFWGFCMALLLNETGFSRGRERKDSFLILKEQASITNYRFGWIHTDVYKEKHHRKTFFLAFLICINSFVCFELLHTILSLLRI